MSQQSGNEPPTRKPDYDRLLHRRKGLSGSEFAGVGIQFALTLVVFTLAGVWLDKRLGTSPWLLILMVFLGAAGGIWSMYYRMVKSVSGPGKSEGRKQ